MSIKEIARRTGLSVPTVGNVFGSNANRYSAETRARVYAAAAEISYRPNSSARAMRKGRIGCAALVLSRDQQNVLSHIPPGLLDGIDDELAKHNMHVTVSRLSDEELSSDSTMPKVLREYMADGMIVNYTHRIPPAMLEQIERHHTPAVWLNAKLTGDCVYPDDYNAALGATRRLIAMGHRRIAFFQVINRDVYDGTFEDFFARMHYSAFDRVKGYREAMTEAGLPLRIVHHNRFIDDAEQLQVAREMLAGENGATAVLAYAEGEVPITLCAAASLGLDVPRDVSLLCFAPAEQRVVGMAVSVLRLPTHEIGQRAVRMLLKKIESADDVQPPEAVAYHEITGHTLAPAKESKRGS